jgi:hypothetical protein
MTGNLNDSSSVPQTADAARLTARRGSDFEYQAFVPSPIGSERAESHTIPWIDKICLLQPGPIRECYGASQDSAKSFILLASPTGFEPVLSP